MDDDLARQFARMGVAVAAPQPAETEAFEVMRVNADALEAWLACETQWRVIVGPSLLSWLGLDYPAVDIVLRRSRFEDPDAVFGDLQVMEETALGVLREKDQ